MYWATSVFVIWCKFSVCLICDNVTRELPYLPSLTWELQYWTLPENSLTFLVLPHPTICTFFWETYMKVIPLLDHFNIRHIGKVLLPVLSVPLLSGIHLLFLKFIFLPKSHRAFPWPHIPNFTYPLCWTNRHLLFFQIHIWRNNFTILHIDTILLFVIFLHIPSPSRNPLDLLLTTSPIFSWPHVPTSLGQSNMHFFQMHIWRIAPNWTTFIFVKWIQFCCLSYLYQCYQKSIWSFLNHT